MDLLIDILLDAGKDTLSLVPFLLVTYLVLETLEHVAGDRVNGAIKRAGAAGPVVGSLLGMVPQCGFSAMAATLYAGRVVTLGTLVAVFLSTSDEMLPLLLAEQVPVQTMAMLLASKALIALVTGFIVDAAIRGLRRNARAHAAIRRTVLGTAANPAHVNCAHDDHSGGDIIDEVAEAGVSADHIHELCERDHCGCDEDEDERDHGHGHDHGHEGEHEHHHGHSHSHKGAPVLSIIRSAISHTVQVSVFIFLVTLILVAVLETFGESAIEQFLRGNETLAVLGSALVGLIPNCSASVAITQLYLEGALQLAPMLAGTLISAGVGYLVLFRTNRSARENAHIGSRINGANRQDARRERPESDLQRLRWEDGHGRIRRGVCEGLQCGKGRE